MDSKSHQFDHRSSISSPPPSYSEVTTTDSLTTDGFVSPMMTTSSPVEFNVSVSPMANTPVTSRSLETLPLPYITESDTSLSDLTPTGNELVRRIDYNCLPQAVIPDGLELAVIEHSSNGDNLQITDVSAPRTDETDYASGLEVVAMPQLVRTVTPLHLLGDQPDSIDCPFCLRRTQTRVKKKPSSTTHLQAVALLMTTVCGAAAPYVAKWSFNVEQWCEGCNNKVMYRAKGKDIHICKVPPSWKEESKYPDANSEMIQAS